MSLDQSAALVSSIEINGTRFIIYDKPFIFMQRIIAVVCEYHHLPERKLISPIRRRPIVRPRQEAMWLCKMLTRHSLSDIGRQFEKQDHTPVINAIKIIDRAIREGKPEQAHILDMLPRFPKVAIESLSHAA